MEVVPIFSSLGFDYIEIVSRDPRSVDIDRYVREPYVNYLQDLVDLAAGIGAKITVTSAGIIEGISREEAYKYCTECLQEIGTCSSLMESGLELKPSVDLLRTLLTERIKL
jgi:hypothetical protein